MRSEQVEPRPLDQLQNAQGLPSTRFFSINFPCSCFSSKYRLSGAKFSSTGHKFKACLFLNAIQKNQQTSAWVETSQETIDSKFIVPMPLCHLFPFLRIQ